MGTRAAGKSILRRRVKLWLAITVIPVLLAGALFVGHYVRVRVFRNNLHVVVPGEVCRSAQPTGALLERWTRRYGFRTVINLRGSSSRSFYVAERAAARRLGIEMIDIRLSAIRLPPPIRLARLIKALETAQRPMLLHCRDGADRTGAASVLAAMAIGRQDYATARGQLSLRYLHVNNSPDSIAGLLKQYEAYCRRKNAPTGAWQQFRQWALEVYRPYYYCVRIDAPRRVVATAGQAIVVPVRILNLSERTIPADDPDRLFRLAAFAGSSRTVAPEHLWGPKSPLPAEPIPPGRAVTVHQKIVAPRRPGQYVIRLDVEERHSAWFGQRGSPVAKCELVVKSARFPRP